MTLNPTPYTLAVHAAPKAEAREAAKGSKGAAAAGAARGAAAAQSPCTLGRIGHAQQ